MHIYLVEIGRNVRRAMDSLVDGDRGLRDDPGHVNILSPDFPTIRRSPDSDVFFISFAISACAKKQGTVYVADQARLR